MNEAPRSQSVKPSAIPPPLPPSLSASRHPPMASDTAYRILTAGAGLGVKMCAVTRERAWSRVHSPPEEIRRTAEMVLASIGARCTGLPDLAVITSSGKWFQRKIIVVIHLIPEGTQTEIIVDAFTMEGLVKSGAAKEAAHDIVELIQKQSDSGRDDQAIAAMRSRWLREMKWTVNHYLSGIPADTFAIEIEKFFNPDHLLKRYVPPPIEFWITPGGKENEFSWVCAVTIERNGSQLDVSFGRLGVGAQTGKSLSLGNLLLTGVISPLGGAAVGLGTKGLEAKFWNYVGAIVQELGAQYPPVLETTSSLSVQNTITGELEQLFKLKNMGAVSEEEYEAKKKELLAQM